MCSGADELIGANLSAYGVEGDHGDEKLGNIIIIMEYILLLLPAVRIIPVLE